MNIVVMFVYAERGRVCRETRTALRLSVLRCVGPALGDRTGRHTRCWRYCCAGCLRVRVLSCCLSHRCEVDADPVFVAVLLRRRLPLLVEVGSLRHSTHRVCFTTRRLHLRFTRRCCCFPGLDRIDLPPLFHLSLRVTCRCRRCSHRSKHHRGCLQVG